MRNPRGGTPPPTETERRKFEAVYAGVEVYADSARPGVYRLFKKKPYPKELTFSVSRTAEKFCMFLVTKLPGITEWKASRKRMGDGLPYGPWMVEFEMPPSPMRTITPTISDYQI